MRETKDSGLEWIGEIPAEWGLSKIGQVYRLRNTKVSDTDYPPLSAPSSEQDKSVVAIRRFFVTRKRQTAAFEWLAVKDTAAKTNAHDDRKLVRKGDFAINSRSDRRGSCGISDYDGSVSLINTILAPLGEMNPGYYDWLFHTVQFGDEFYKFGHGIVDDLWTTGWQDMKKITIPTPPLAEQRRIADFLDAKCAEIDALIADIQTQIDTLEQYKRSIITETVTKGLNPDAEMKDSGIEWIGQMPLAWDAVPNKYLMYKVKNVCPVYNGEDILSLTTNGVIIRDLNGGGKMPTSFDGYQKVTPGNLLMCLFDIDVTPRCIGLVKNFGLTSPAYSQFVMRTGVYAPYYYYYYLMVDYTKELLHMAKNLRHSLTEDQLGAIKAPNPPYEEQVQIAEFLDKKCVEISRVIEDKNKQLATLDEYKKSLIFEYVTGKKEVV